MKARIENTTNFEISSLVTAEEHHQSSNQQRAEFIRQFVAQAFALFSIDNVMVVKTTVDFSSFHSQYLLLFAKSFTGMKAVPSGGIPH